MVYRCVDEPFKQAFMRQAFDRSSHYSQQKYGQIEDSRNWRKTNVMFYKHFNKGSLFQASHINH
jgi:hypothetical protein